MLHKDTIKNTESTEKVKPKQENLSFDMIGSFEEMKMNKMHSEIPKYKFGSLMENSTKAESINFSSPIIKRRNTIIDKSMIKNLSEIKTKQCILECRKCTCLL